MTERIFKGKGKSFKADVLIQSVPGKDYLEMMAGANKWHERARFVFAQEKGLDLELVEANLHEGKQIVEDGQEGHVFGFRKQALDLYREYEQKVEEIGGGDVIQYAKKTSNLTRKQIDVRMQAYFENH